jgi:phospholipase C
MALLRTERHHHLERPGGIKHLCNPAGDPPKCTGPDYVNGNIVGDPAQILKDIPGGKLPSVSWVIPTGLASDHARETDGSGPSWVASIVNAIGKSACWNNTVILITWDDWGGWYDHVKPPAATRYGYYEIGFRVPLLVISAYTPQGYVSNVDHSFGSILRFVETAYGLPLIFPGHYLDSRSDDLSDFFNFQTAPRRFTPVPAPKSADFILHDKRPQTDPDDDADAADDDD